MAKFQLWSRDEYGQGSIIATSEDLSEIVKRAKQEVTTANVNNALTTDDRERAWEVYFPVITSSVKTEEKKHLYLYGGRGALNREIFYAVDKSTGEVSEISWDNMKKPVVKIYLGNVSTSREREEDWYAKDRRLKPIEKINDPELVDKTMLFVKVV